MRFVIQKGSFRIIYSTLENLDEDDAKAFRLLIHFRALEMERNSKIYRLITQ